MRAACKIRANHGLIMSKQGIHIMLPNVDSAGAKSARHCA
jgi:hypothetical protein